MNPSKMVVVQKRAAYFLKFLKTENLCALMNLNQIMNET